MRKNKGFTIVELLIVIVVIIAILVGPIGYVKNIIGLIECDFEAPYKAEVIRGVGVVVPFVGVVVGWVGIEDVVENK